MASILFVCTGNICRSPIAEASLRAAIRRLSDQPIEVSSAGTSGWDGSPATPDAVRAAAERELDISGHVARRLTAAHVDSADLVIGLSEEHRDAAARLAQNAGSRTFTLKELVGLLEALPAGSAGEWEERVAAAHDSRSGSLADTGSDLGIVDPLRMQYETYRAVAWEIDELCERLAAALVSPAPAPSSLSDSEA